MAGAQIERAVVGVAGPAVKSFNSRQVVAVAAKNREISREDIQRSLDAARSVPIPSEFEILHVLPREFVVDGQDGVADPLGMVGSRLEADVHVVTVPVATTQNLLNCVNRAGVEVIEMVLEPLAASEAVLTADERELGVVLADVGGGTTEIAVWRHGTLAHTSVLPVGGDHFTNDLAVVLKTPVPDAERLKRKHGAALAALVNEADSIDVPAHGRAGASIPSSGARSPRSSSRAPRSSSRSCGRSRVREVPAGELRAGLVLTGGGSELDGLLEVAEQVLGVAVRRGVPRGLGGLTDIVASPEWACAAGLLLYGRGAAAAVPTRGRAARRRASSTSSKAPSETCSPRPPLCDIDGGKTMILFDDDDAGSKRTSRTITFSEDTAPPARIKVVGVGGGGGNAVNRMIQAGIKGIEFVAANTDLQVLKVNRARDEAAARDHDVPRHGRRVEPGRRPQRRARGRREDHGGPRRVGHGLRDRRHGRRHGDGRRARRRAARVRGRGARRRDREQAVRVRGAAQAPLRRGRHRRAARVRRHAHHDPERAPLLVRGPQRHDVGGLPHRGRRPAPGRAGDQRPHHGARHREPRLRGREDGHGEHGDGAHGDRHGDGRAPRRRGRPARDLEPAPRGAVHPGRPRDPHQRHGRRGPHARRGERGLRDHPAGRRRGGERHLRPRPGQGHEGRGQDQRHRDGLRRPGRARLAPRGLAPGEPDGRPRPRAGAPRSRPPSPPCP